MGRHTWLWACVVLLFGVSPAMVTAQDDTNANQQTSASDLLQRFQSRLDDEVSGASSRMGRVAGEAASRISSLRSNGDVGEAEDSYNRARALVVVQSEAAIRRAAVHRRLGMASLIRAGATPAQVATFAQRSITTVASIREARRQALQQIRAASKSSAGLTTVNG
jgi:hypothetical protein